MKKLHKWANKRSYPIYILAFLLMSISPIGSYYSAQAGSDGWCVAFLTLVVIGNILVLFPR